MQLSTFYPLIITLSLAITIQVYQFFRRRLLGNKIFMAKVRQVHFEKDKKKGQRFATLISWSLLIGWSLLTEVLPDTDSFRSLFTMITKPELSFKNLLVWILSLIVFIWTNDALLRIYYRSFFARIPVGICEGGIYFGSKSIPWHRIGSINIYPNHFTIWEKSVQWQFNRTLEKEVVYHLKSAIEKKDTLRIFT